MKHSNLYSTKSDSYYAESREEILSFVPSQIQSALDIGCGKGIFGKILKEKFNCEVWGVEPDKDSAVIAGANLDCVLNSLFDRDLDFQGKKFDCIFFNDVLEHLVDPTDALLIANNLLKSNGCIISSIPNILHFFTIWRIIETQDWKYEEAGIMDKTHLRFFTKKSIIRMFEECGFKVEEIQGINPTLGKKYLALNTLLFNKIKDMRYRQFVVIAKR